jgi:hypothetical protein
MQTETDIQRVNETHTDNLIRFGKRHNGSINERKVVVRYKSKYSLIYKKFDVTDLTDQIFRAYRIVIILINI